MCEVYHNSLIAYKGIQDASPNEAATIGRVKGIEYLVKYMEHRRWDMKHQSSEFEIRYLADWFVLKLKYMDLGIEEIEYGQGDLRFRKEFIRTIERIRLPRKNLAI